MDNIEIRKKLTECRTFIEQHSEIAKCDENIITTLPKQQRKELLLGIIPVKETQLSSIYSQVCDKISLNDFKGDIIDLAQNGVISGIDNVGEINVILPLNRRKLVMVRKLPKN